MSEIDQRSSVEQEQEEDQTQDLKFFRSSISWRRNLVLQMLSEGHNQAHIARTLKLHPSTISIDVQYLREETRRQMRTFITERLPMAVTKSCAALDSITATAWNIAKNTEDDRVKLNALTLVKETEKDKIDIVSNVNLVDQIVSETDQRQQTQQDPAQLVGQGSEEDLPQLGESENNLLQPVVVSSEELDTDSPEEEEDPAPVTRARAIPVDDSGDRD